MKLFAPSYYQTFKCIAERCRHSCCIGWEIDVDDGAYRKYAEAKAPYAQRVLKSIEDGDGVRHFRLAKEERCPHLDETGLCRIICEMGEEYLCEICREHPRFYHNTAHGKEVGLGMACEEACRLILSAEDYRTLSVIGECEGEASIGDFDSVAEREALYAILSDPSLPYPERLGVIYQKYGVSPAIHTDEAWREMLHALEYLNPSHEDLFSCFTASAVSPEGAEIALERALAYFVFRHASRAESYEEFRASLGFALFCERLLASMLSAQNNADFEQICDLARILSEELEYSEDNTLAITEEFFFSL